MKPRHAITAAAAAASLFCAGAGAQVIGTTNTLEHVASSTGMWVPEDPFGFRALSNSVAHAAEAGLHFAPGEKASVTSRLSSAEAAAAAAYGPSNPPPAFTNAYLTAEIDTNGWWTPYIVTNGVRSVLQ